MSWVIYCIVRLVETVICLLPLKLVVRVGRFLGWIAWAIMRSYRLVALRNLEIAFPDKSLKERKKIAREHFISLGGNLLAGPKLARFTKDDLMAVVSVEGLDIMSSDTLKGRGCVFTVSHLGNWEILALISPFIMGRPCGTVYQRLGNHHLDAHVRHTRGRFGLSLFERKEGFNKAIELLRNHGGLGVLIDQHAGDAGVWCPMFNRLASTSPLACTLAQRTGAVILPIVVYTDGIARWRCVISPPLAPRSNDVAHQTAELNLTLATQIRKQPSDWFWVHNRWKTPSPKFLLATYKRGVVFADARDPENLQPFKILIRTSNWLGDAVMNVPAVVAIKKGRPDAQITIVCPAKLEAVWKQIPEVDEVVTLPTQKGLLSFLHFVESLRNRNFDAAVVFPNSIRTALEIWMANIPRRVGFPGHAPRTLFLNQVFREKKKRKKTVVPPTPVHQLNHYLALAKFIGAEIEGITAENCFVRIEKDLHTGRTKVALCPGAEYGPAKRWLPERYAEVIKQISATRDCDWLLVGVEKDRSIGEEIQRLAGVEAVQNLCGKTSLEELITLLRDCRLLLTNDTGTMHLAAMLGTPTVSIFGSTEPTLTGPLGNGHVVLRKKVECSPCFLRECPIDFRCMKAIEADEVVAAVKSILSP